MSNCADDTAKCSLNLETSMRLIDPVLQFLTKATGEATVPLTMLQKALPQHPSLGADVRLLVSHRVLRLCNDEDDRSIEKVGFPLKDNDSGLHSSTKRAAQKRLVALRKSAREEKKPRISKRPIPDSSAFDFDESSAAIPAVTVEKASVDRKRSAGKVAMCEKDDKEHRIALSALDSLLGFNTTLVVNDKLPTGTLPRQVAFAGSKPSQDASYATLPNEVRDRIPDELWSAMCGCRQLYSHQARVIESALRREHCSICTGTGSGKSLCFLLPVLTAAYHGEGSSLLLFPTKALAQDQLSKLQTMLELDTRLSQKIRPSTLDGDTPHTSRKSVAENCNVVLTNPDTLHAAILPAWQSTYQPLLQRLQYVVIDEAHTYDGVFGAHVAMVLRRLVRVCGHRITFISASATLAWPREHFRLLCPIAESEDVSVVDSDEDGSPRAAKHFFVWNPPVLNPDRTSTGQVTFPPAAFAAMKGKGTKTKSRRGLTKHLAARNLSETEDGIMTPTTGIAVEFRRRHAADETAHLFAKAVVAGVRVIAFCKTRNLVEWVYSKTLELLKADPETFNLSSKIESYRGGYTMKERRKIEQRLFRNDLRGVVGTNALELGVDLGGIDLTLHCGYPTSYASLQQQAGRAGRGAARLGTQSVAIVICFNSPSEQHMWKCPKTLLAKGFASSLSIPIRRDMVQGHMLCASEETPLTGDQPALTIYGKKNLDVDKVSALRGDRQVFGEKVYDAALAAMKSCHSLSAETIPDPSNHEETITIFKSRPSFRKSWSRVSIRSIEPISYSIVDLAHPSQKGRVDSIHDEDAVLDTIPYSRVFYHAHPGSILNHRGKRYKIVSMSRPPPFSSENFGCMKASTLGAFAKPTNAQYLTRPLSKMFITVVKQIEAVTIIDGPTSMTLIGCGEVNVKRQVHGYKKLSLITRQEIGRFELSLPSLEYDTFGIYICADPSFLKPRLGDLFGPGVHALSHALLAVAPVCDAGLQRDDLECDHSHWEPTQIVLFDQQAGGSGCVERLWRCFFQKDNIVQEAVDLLRECAQCSADKNYDYGCPACIHAHNCLSFNMHLSKKAAIAIGERMLLRLQQTEQYKQNVQESEGETETTPRRMLRSKKMKQAKELHAARERSFVVGRPSWPLDPGTGQNRQETS